MLRVVAALLVLGPAACHHRYPDAPPDLGDSQDLPAADLSLRDVRAERRVMDNRPHEQSLVPDYGLGPDVCANGSISVWSGFQNTVVACQAPSRVSQCQAPDLCGKNNGWLICDGSAYLAMYAKGFQPVPAARGKWIQSCAFDPSGTVHLDKPCPAGPPGAKNCCTGGCTGGTESIVAWTCSGAPVRSFYEAAGMVTGGECHRTKDSLGKQHEAYWRPHALDGRSVNLESDANGTLCCLGIVW